MTRRRPPRPRWVVHFPLDLTRPPITWRALFVRIVLGVAAIQAVYWAIYFAYAYAITHR